jgi:hypothetical protein
MTRTSCSSVRCSSEVIVAELGLHGTAAAAWRWATASSATFVSSVFSCYLTVMGLPRDLIRTIGHLKTTSALAPLLMPAGLIGVFAVLMTIVGGPHHPLTWVLWIFFIIWMVAIGGAYIFWSFKDPDRLQTENYQLEQQRINLIGDERNPGKVIEGSPLTSNTAMQVSK